jgi:hypothetical protein
MLAHALTQVVCEDFGDGDFFSEGCGQGFSRLEALVQHLVDVHGKPAESIINHDVVSEQAFSDYKLELEQQCSCYFRLNKSRGTTSLYRCSCHGDHRGVAEPKLVRHKSSKLVGRFLRVVHDSEAMTWKVVSCSCIHVCWIVARLLA